jgi:hypothetical protein
MNCKVTQLGARRLVIVILLLGTWVSAYAGINVNIDGNDDEWGAEQLAFTDPNEAGEGLANIPDYWDINEVYYHYDDDYLYWGVNTYDSIENSPNSWYVNEVLYVLIDYDTDNLTGHKAYSIPGIDVYLKWEPIDDTFRYYKWNEAQNRWDIQSLTGYTYEVACGQHTGGASDYDFFEVKFPKAAIEDVKGGPLAKIDWGWAYDNADLPADDMAPDDGEHETDTPEPTTLVMLVLGLSAIGLRKRMTKR